MTSSALALAVTTSTGVTGVAVGPIGPDRAGTVVSRLVETDRRHAEELPPMLREALAEADTTMADLGLLVVDVGPGRFTGLRVGLATVRALAFARNIPVVGLTSLEVLASAVDNDQPVTAVVDARRGEVFQQTFAEPPGRNPLSQPLVGRAEALAPDAVGVASGDGVDLYRDAYESSASGLTVLSGRNPDPVVMLRIAAERQAVEGSKILPLYLRDPDVNPNVKTRPVADRGQTPAGSTS